MLSNSFRQRTVCRSANGPLWLLAPVDLLVSSSPTLACRPSGQSIRQSRRRVVTVDIDGHHPVRLVDSDSVDVDDVGGVQIGIDEVCAGQGVLGVKIRLGFEVGQRVAGCQVDHAHGAGFTFADE
jgi:hypothetical protein